MRRVCMRWPNDSSRKKNWIRLPTHRHTHMGNAIWSHAFCGKAQLISHVKWATICLSPLHILDHSGNVIISFCYLWICHFYGCPHGTHANVLISPSVPNRNAGCINKSNWNKTRHSSFAFAFNGMCVCVLCSNKWICIDLQYKIQCFKAQIGGHLLQNLMDHHLHLTHIDEMKKKTKKKFLQWPNSGLLWIEPKSK